MTIFAYTVLNRGVRQEGVLQAPSREEAAKRLKQEYRLLLKLEEAPDRTVSKVHRGRLERLACHVLIRSVHLEVALGQLAQVIRGGVPILISLNAVGGQSSFLLRRAFHDIAERVKSGQSLERSLRAEAPFLGRVTIGLVGVGESNGTLDEMLRYSADLMERRRKVKAQVLGALTYPVFVVLGALGLGYYMVRYVIPKIMSFIGTQDITSLPLVTQYLVRTNDFLTVYGIYILVLPFILVGLVVAARKNQKTAPVVDQVLLWVPPVGKALRAHANTMWCRTLGALLRSGIDILNALELVISTMDNACYKQRLLRIRQQIRQGSTLTRAYAANGMRRLCPIGHTMIAISEEGGGLDENLLHVADYSEEQLTRRVAMLSKMIEPTIFVLVGGMVGFVYFAFFMAMLTATNRAAGM